MLRPYLVNIKSHLQDFVDKVYNLHAYKYGVLINLQ